MSHLPKQEGQCGLAAPERVRVPDGPLFLRHPLLTPCVLTVVNCPKVEAINLQIEGGKILEAQALG